MSGDPTRLSLNENLTNVCEMKGSRSLNSTVVIQFSFYRETILFFYSTIVKFIRESTHGLHVQIALDLWRIRMSWRARLFRRRNASKDHKFLSSGIQTEFLRPTVSRVSYPRIRRSPTSAEFQVLLLAEEGAARLTQTQFPAEFFGGNTRDSRASNANLQNASASRRDAFGKTVTSFYSFDNLYINYVDARKPTILPIIAQYSKLAEERERLCCGSLFLFFSFFSW